MSRSREERRVEVQVGSLFGVDVRPTRVFVWPGDERGRARILPLGRAPRTLRLPQRHRHLEAGPLRVTVLGNPLVTLGQTGVALARAAHRSRTGLSSRELPR